MKKTYILTFLILIFLSGPVSAETLYIPYSGFVYNATGEIWCVRQSVFQLSTGEGFAEYLLQAESFHEHKGRFENKGLSHYIQEKVKAKSRKYNTLDNRDTEQLKKIKLEQAKAYKKEKGGR